MSWFGCGRRDMRIRSYDRLAGSRRIMETKWKGSRAREGNGYKLWYSGSSNARNGVGIILAGRLTDNVVRVTRRSNRVMAISVVIEGETVNVISAYAPQVGLSDAKKKRFWDALDELGRECPTDQRLIIGGDLNGHIGAATDGYAGLHGGFGFRDRNEEGLKNSFRCRECEKQSINEDFIEKLDSKEGANDIYKIAKARERRRRDIGNVRYIKDEGGCTIVREEDIRKRRGEYLSSLFNENPSYESRADVSREVGSPSPHMHYECYYSKINQGEVKVALKKMERNKAVGPDQIPIEAWRSLEDEGVKWLTCLFNKIFSISKMPDEWRLSEVIPIYKNKGDAQACSNYRGIKLLSHTMKLWERVIERRLRRETKVSENQFGFMPGRSMTKAIHLLRSLMEKYRERQRDLHMAFLDLEKAYDSVPRELVWKTLIDKGTPRRYSRVIKDMYEGAKTRVRTTVGNTDFFPAEVGLHQGSAISPYLFTLILDELLRGFKRTFLEDNGLRASIEKTEYLRCDFGRYEVVHQEVDIRIGYQILRPKESFRYLGLVIHRSGRIDDDVAHRIRAGVAIRQAMMYDSECWQITKAQATRVEVAKLRMLRWICGKTMIDMIPNGVFRAELDVDSIVDKMREGRLRWFGHVKRRPQNTMVRKVESMEVEGSRRPKLRWENRLKLDIKELFLSVDMTSDRNVWRDRIRISG
ncbi:retrovirus-related pol polyprotein LINE-1 [Tanacetum coccineum]